MSEPQTLIPPVYQDIILDTCILTYLSDEKIKAQVLSYLSELIKRNFILAVSEVTCFEILAEAPKNKEQEIISTLDYFKRYLVDLNVLIVAASLATSYKVQANCENKQLPKISEADKIIAATSALTGAPILTANVNDFPRPLFYEAEERQIFYKDGNKTNMLVIQALKPNSSILQQRYIERK